MKTKCYGFTVLIILMALLFFNCSGSSEEENQENIITEKNTETSDATCDCESSWFDGSTILAPEEGPNSPFGAASTTNCLFHQWSWQKFLYLTQINEGETLPYFLASMDQVTSEMTPVTSENATLVLTEYKQAGGGGILMTNPTYGTSDTLFYSIHINQIFKKKAIEMEQMIENDPSQVTNRETFPVGALELKASWVKADAIEESQHNNYYSTTATFGNSNTPEKVLFMGMHVVGVVENHPEFIWATFEHNGLAAFYDWASTSGSDVPVTSGSNLPLFEEGSTAGIDAITWSGTAIKNPNNVFTVYKYGTPRVPGNGFMADLSQSSGAENYNNIDSLNKSVHDTISQKGLDLWTNYFYNGSLWMNMDGTTPEQQVDSILKYTSNFGDPNAGTPFRGSLAAANITMETYEQLTNTDAIHSAAADNLMNCLICHGPSSYLPIADSTGAQSPLYISHVFMNYMHDKDPNKSIKEIRAMRFKLFNQVRDK